MKKSEHKPSGKNTMLSFYKNAAIAFSGLIVITTLFATYSVKKTTSFDALFPVSESTLPWNLISYIDTESGGTSSTIVKDQVRKLDYSYTLTREKKYPYVMQALAFSDLTNISAYADLSAYTNATFKVRCEPSNDLFFYIHTGDEKIKIPEDIFSLRIASESFSCNEEWVDVVIDLHSMKVPIWWLENNGFLVSDQQYRLDKVFAITFDSNRGPIDTLANVTVKDLKLHKINWGVLGVFLVVIFVIWAAFIVVLIKIYTTCLRIEIKERLIKNRPLIAYQQLSIYPYKNKEKSELLKFMAAGYENPEMSLNFTADALNINRTKVNELLREELGLTFTSYLNRLRLTKAARMLSQQEQLSVEDIAYSVGYNNVSYFIKLFKLEYGYTPSKFKSVNEINKMTT